MGICVFTYVYMCVCIYVYVCACVHVLSVGLGIIKVKCPVQNRIHRRYSSVKGIHAVVENMIQFLGIVCLI